MYTQPRSSAPKSLYEAPKHTVKTQAKTLFTFINGLLTPIKEVPSYDFR
ncbi:hypothetical protein Q5H92_14600 [Hymenobacter sp. M29]|uniref:Uncharacterized protein n=1 Tax=Hymenobacter mellowenesis TaxID=3063995 RepID=A0ABT9AFY6_9BACT|nr:hypothetical protein [Hymenobacter sp. M29]MDO7847597.1 hypothetical protein [Hymenobacter sp. M29]